MTTITFSKDTSREWSKDPEYNLMIIRGVETWANAKLKVCGWVGLYEIETELGIPKNVVTYDPNTSTFTSGCVLYAWVLANGDRVTLDCIQQPNGDILIEVKNGGAYPIVLTREIR